MLMQVAHYASVMPLHQHCYLSRQVCIANISLAQFQDNQHGWV